MPPLASLCKTEASLWVAGALLIAGAAGLIADKSFAPYAIASAIALLLLADIYGAWTITLWAAMKGS